MGIIGPRHRMAVIPVLVALVVLSTACSIGSQSSPQTGPIAMGTIWPITGRIADIGQSFLRGSQLGVQEVNSNGGVMGRQLQEFDADDAGDAVDAVPAFRQLQTHHVSFVTGPSGLTFAPLQPLIDSAQVVAFPTIGSANWDTLNDKWVYRNVVSDSVLVKAMTYYAIKQGWTKCAAAFLNDASSQGIIQLLGPSYQAHGGTLTANISLVGSQSSYRSEVINLFAGNPQCVFIQTDVSTTATFFANVRELGHLNVPFVGTDQYSEPGTAKAIGFADASKWTTGMQGAQPSGPAYDHFNNAFKVKFPSNLPSYFVAANYDSVIVAALAMTAAGSSDPKVWVSKIASVTNNESGTQVSTYADGAAALKAGKSIDYEGASGSMDFDSHHNVYTGFKIVKFDPTGQSVQTVLDIPDSALAGWS